MRYAPKLIASIAVAAMAASAAGTSQATETVKLAIGQKGLWDTMITVFADEQGFLKKENIEADITWTSGGSATLQAVVTGSADFAMTNGILGVLGAYAKGAPIRIVSAQATGAPDLFWYAKADSGIKTLKDAAGKTMGFSRPGSSTNLTALSLAAHYGVQPKLVPTGGISGTRTHVMSGQIDIGWSVPPFNLELIQKGDIHIVARGSDVPDLAEQTVRVNVVNADYLKNNRKTATGFMRAYANALDWMYANQDLAVKSYAAFNKVDEGVAREALKFYPKAMLQPTPIKGFDQSVAQAIEYKRLTQPLTAEQKAELIQLLN